MAVKTAPRDRKLRFELAKVRKKRGVSLDSIAEATKISKRFLEAIEAEKFDDLPGGIFNTNYLKQYALAIGFDAEQLLEYYRDRTEPPAEDHPVEPKRPLWNRLFRGGSQSSSSSTTFSRSGA